MTGASKLCNLCLKGLEDKYELTLQDEAKDLEQLLNRRNLLHVKREDLMKKIRDLGSLPSDAFEKYVKFTHLY